MIRRTPSARPGQALDFPSADLHNASLPDTVLPAGGDFRGNESGKELSEPGQRERCRLARRGGPQLPAAGKMIARSRREAQDRPGCSPTRPGYAGRACRAWGSLYPDALPPEENATPMTRGSGPPEFALTLERLFDAPVRGVWRCWTEGAAGRRIRGWTRQASGVSATPER